MASIWSMRFQQLCKFKEQFGHYLVPKQYADNPKLRQWVSTQRKNYRLHREGKPSPMTEKNIRELESVGSVQYQASKREGRKEKYLDRQPAPMLLLSAVT